MTRETKCRWPYPVSDNVRIQKRLLRAINPVSIAVVFLFVLVVIASVRIGIPFDVSFKWLLLPSLQECRNFGGSLFTISFVISYVLMLTTIAFVMLVIESETEKQYMAFSFLGIVTAVAWFAWGVFIFLLCGLRPH